MNLLLRLLASLFPVRGELVPAAGVFFGGEGEAELRGNPAGDRDDPDRALVLAARGGDADAFERIVVKFQRPAFNIALRMLGDREEARDLAQEVFIRIWRSLASFREEARFSHWFYTVLMNACRSRLRHLKRRAFFRSEPLDDPPPGADDGRPARQFADPAPGAADVLQEREMARRLEQGMRMVPADYREVLLLRDVQGQAYEEIAAALGLNVGTVKSRLHRGRAALRELLAPGGEEEGP